MVPLDWSFINICTWEINPLLSRLLTLSILSMHAAHFSYIIIVK